MTSKSHISDQITTIIGIIVLIGASLGSWLPTGCPVVRKAIAGCPRTAPPPNSELAELEKYPYQTVTTNLLYFTTKSEKKRDETQINFFFYTNLAKEIAFLQVKKSDGFHDIGMITHPLLSKIDWNSHSEDGFQLLQKVDRFPTIADFLSHMPPSRQITADRFAASEYQLKPGTYLPMEQVTELNDIEYILTSSPRMERDGNWTHYLRSIDLTDAEPDKDDKIEWTINRENNQNDENPFHISTVHIDYRQPQP